MNRALGFAYTILKSNLGPLPLPYRLNFSTTYNCQSRCVMCNIWEKRPVGELSLDEIKTFAEKNRNFRWVQLTGGEPFLRRDIVDIAQAFMETSPLYILTMPTNSLCSVDLVEKRVGELLELKPPRFTLTLSLDGYKFLHDEIRGVKGNFDKVMEVYQTLKPFEHWNKNFRLIFGFTIIRKNVVFLEETVKAVHDRFPEVTEDDFHLNLGQTSDHYYSNAQGDFSVSRGDAALAIEGSLARRSKIKLDFLSILESRFHRGLLEYIRNGKGPNPTRELDASVFLDSFGNVFPSIMWSDRIGNIRESEFDLKKIWTGEASVKARDMIKNHQNPSHWTSCESYSAILGDL